MSDTNTEDTTRRDGSRSSEGLGPLPEAALTVVHNAHTMERQVSTHGVAYYGSNWYAEHECYTADQMRAERERCYELGLAAGAKRGAAIARRFGAAHDDGVTVNARNAADKIARGIEGPNDSLSSAR